MMWLLWWLLETVREHLRGVFVDAGEGDYR